MKREEYKYKHLYYVPFENESFSNLAAGMIGRALGHNLNVGIINSEGKKLVEFFNSFNAGEVELIDSLYDVEEKFDLVIVDSSEFETEFLDYQLNFELVIITTQLDKYEELVQKVDFDLVSYFNYDKKVNPKSNLTLITGNGKGKSTFCFGRYLKECIDNSNKTSLIYFDKGGDFYGERNTFSKLDVENCDFHVYGKERFDGKKFRFNNIEEDFEEVEKGLKHLDLLKNEKDLIILEEINTLIATKLSTEEKIKEILHSERPFIASGRYAPDSLKEIAAEVIEIDEVKHYVKKGVKVREGIDL